MVDPAADRMRNKLQPIDRAWAGRVLACSQPQYPVAAAPGVSRRSGIGGESLKRQHRQRVGCLTKRFAQIAGTGRPNRVDTVVAGSPADGRGHRLDRGSIAADAANGADGIFESPAYPDDPAAGMAFTTERNVDAQSPQERLRATQAASEHAGIFGPACTSP
jgi:hypothetical protein